MGSECGIPVARLLLFVRGVQSECAAAAPVRGPPVHDLAAPTCVCARSHTAQCAAEPNECAPVRAPPASVACACARPRALDTEPPAARRSCCAHLPNQFLRPPAPAPATRSASRSPPTPLAARSPSLGRPRMCTRPLAPARPGPGGCWHGCAPVAARRPARQRPPIGRPLICLVGSPTAPDPFLSLSGPNTSGPRRPDAKWAGCELAQPPIYANIRRLAKLVGPRACQARHCVCVCVCLSERQRETARRRSTQIKL